MILSICIPTYNNSSDLVRVIERISTDAQGWETDYEILVSDNNSTKNHQQTLSNISVSNCKISFNEINVGFGENLLKSLRMASGSFLLLLGDDDIPELGLISELIQYLKNGCHRNMFFLPIEGTPNPKHFPKFVVTWITMRSGSMMGIVIPNLKSEINKVNFKNVLYPQIELVFRVYSVVGFHNFISEKNIVAGQGLPLIDRFSDKMNRPSDYGVAERISLLYRLREEKLINFRDYWKSLVALLHWAVSIFNELYSHDRKVAWRYAKAIFLGIPNRIFVLVVLFGYFTKKFAKETFE